MRNKQKLVSFTNNSPELEQISADLKDGWRIISLIKNGNYYVGIMEEMDIAASIESQTIFIPPRKKIKILK